MAAGHIDSLYRDMGLHRQIAELGAELGPQVRDSTIDLYASCPRDMKHGIIRDIFYGPHARHRLDVHQPLTLDGLSRPVFCFVHGGGFTGGDKNKSGQPYYDNVGGWAVACGFIGINITYRFAPEYTFPAGAEDVALAIAWIQSHAAEFGGDGARVVVMGHSAGAAHVASSIVSPELCSVFHRPIAGAILSSGIYDPSIGADAYSSYYGDDRSLLGSRSSIPGLCDTGIPTLMSTAEFDPLDIQRQTIELVKAYAEHHGRFPALIQADGHNHYSVVYQFGTSEVWFTSRLQRFVEKASRV